jgi:polar amino acid transport system substrate-binding protein
VPKPDTPDFPPFPAYLCVLQFVIAKESCGQQYLKEIPESRRPLSNDLGKRVMKPSHIGLVVILSVVAAYATATFAVKHNVVSAVAKETRLEQIKRTGVLRCGYATWPPFLTKDPNTGEISGLNHDLVEEMGRQLKIKIEWVGEVASGQMLADLAMNRYDMICTIYGLTPGRAREASFTSPFVYLPINMYVRKDDTRFDQDFDLANKPEIKFASLDGEFSSIGAAENFPASTKVSVPQLSTPADLFMSVETKKADAVLQDPFVFEEYNKKNPGVLRPAGNKVLRALACGMPIPANEAALKDTLDTTIAYLQDSGFIEKLMKKYEGDAKYVRPAKNYAE